ncbi:AzlD domain-containing protein [Streptococcus gordonii]|uniref:Integral membrane protein n=1 Tax=Streptococcus gordonii (strain Challis / ATCC 35105 / BCRC 15272 / CH1 / DL1 / V288) TaxID=467705 RepID=A8AUT4_STRGC|nr:AzlD domain-containing protein [Streptococcus gordonii]ABV09142.1 integral membrane protein [Streptococcus gordonii str. Challis substr. CH1]MBW7663303.1 AzlD domain-containing protein [Streptococcus gordonii]MBZ2137093.1 AzlD domain-containing protein [Streptococcus gordonii]QGS44599.1 AzlD domain-containing protein [Streptococcus gordonii]RSJ59655.1 Branched-chain amino acid transport protein (AzlD) [Streptococcus gordonii]
MISKYILLAILLSALVTWIPRVLPFILVKYKGLPPMVERFLKYLPVSIIFALILSSVTNAKTGQLPSFKWLDLLAVFPTTYIAFKYKNLILTVICGVVLVALLRLVIQMI